jgi:hypothetical protein
MRGTIRRFVRASLRLAFAAAAFSAACASPQPTQPIPPASPDPDADVIRRATAVCTNTARDGGLKVLEYRTWSKTGPDAWSGRLFVRPEGGGLSYEVDCRYKPSRETASLVRP